MLEKYFEKCYEYSQGQLYGKKQVSQQLQPSKKIQINRRSSKQAKTKIDKLFRPKNGSDRLTSCRKIRDMKTTEDYVRGLENLGSTCYLNSVLQSLLHIPYLSKIISNPESFSKSAGPVSTAFAQLFESYYSASAPETIKPGSLLEAIAK